MVGSVQYSNTCKLCCYLFGRNLISWLMVTHAQVPSSIAAAGFCPTALHGSKLALPSQVHLQEKALLCPGPGEVTQKIQPPSGLYTFF